MVSLKNRVLLTIKNSIKGYNLKTGGIMLPLKKLVVIFIALSVVVGCSSNVKVKQENEKSAIEAAQKWHALLETGNYGESWEQAADILKKAITQGQWDTTNTMVRSQLGMGMKRELQAVVYKEQLPGVPRGMYYILTFKVHFENSKSATETITMMKDEKGVWKCAGYFIK